MIFNAYQDSKTGIGGISVISSGHIFAQKGRKIDRPKGRSDYLLFYIAKGKELFYLKNEIVGEEGSFIIFRPFEKQEHIYIDNKPGEFYFIHFDAPDNFDLFEFESSVLYNSKLSTAICDLFEEIIDELQKKQPAYEKLCTSKLFTIFSLLERKSRKETSAKEKYFDKISFVIQKMNKEYYMDYSLDDYAKICNMSKFHFLRVFKDITGESPLEYRNIIRLNHVKEYLKDTNIPINEIAEKTGFTSASYFCDAFRRKVGMSPVQYRKEHSANHR
ncbi:MAG: helix-turn-helix transcriptional regulator [Clostridia bacterium]|nr:helix-turn-helix transcriptional regulator [Clostridia bacterium]